MAFAALLLVFPAAAQPTLRVEAPNLVAVDEQFNVTFIIEGENAPSDFSWEPGSDFQLVWGPQKGSSTSISIVNGKKSRSSQTTYTYVLLPRAAGSFQLPEAHATVKGSPLVSKRVLVEVVSDGKGAAPSSSGSAREERQADQGRAQLSGEDLFLRLSLSKNRVVVGESVTATLKLYQRVNISGFEDARFPSFKGCWSQEVQAPTNIEFHRESVGDLIYNAAVLRSWTLIPQQAGDLEIEPAELVCLVAVRARRSGGSIFDSFFQDDYQTVRKRVSTSPGVLHVAALPVGAPSSFGGGVGTGFRLEAALTPDSLRTHDAGSLRITVTGKGNTSLLEAPKLRFPPDFEVYDVKSSDVRGGRSFEYPFIPRSAGDFEIGPVEYTYYDISQNRYVTLHTEVLPVRVARGNEQEVAAPAQSWTGASGRSDVRDLGSDIRYIRTRMPRLREPGRFFVGSPLFWGMTVLLPLLAALTALLLRRRAQRRADLVGSRRRGASRMARRRLSEAASYLGKNLYSAFYEALHKALLGYVSDKLALDVSETDTETIAARLAEAGVDEGTCSELTQLLDACAFARYAPDAGNEAMNTHYEQAVQVISSIDERMKHQIVKKPHPGMLALLALSLFAPGLRAQQHASADSLWQAGVQAYADSRWEDAGRAWSAVAGLGLASPELYVNLGNACFKSGETGRAVLWYERALKLDPSDKDARYNLTQVSARLQDRLETVPEFFLVTWMRRLGWSLSSDAWAVAFLVFLALALACVLLFLLGRSAGSRRAGFFTGLSCLLLSLLCLGFAFWQKRAFRQDVDAVVMKPVSAVKSAPGGDAKDLFILHEGTKVECLDTVRDWTDIELSDGRQGWIPSADIEVI